jgi:hypothetical protein
MPKFGTLSTANLSECHADLVKLFNEVIKHRDCQIIDGGRTYDEQVKNVAKGVSQTMNSLHVISATRRKSLAVDVMPYPFDWNKIEKGLNALKHADPSMQIAEVYHFQGFVLGIATMMGIDIRQGVDWNGNGQFEDSSFVDLPHNELADP